MDSVSLRLECLRLAARENQSHETVVVAARSYLAFITTSNDEALASTTAPRPESLVSSKDSV